MRRGTSRESDMRAQRDFKNQMAPSIHDQMFLNRDTAQVCNQTRRAAYQLKTALTFAGDVFYTLLLFAPLFAGLHRAWKTSRWVCTTTIESLTRSFVAKSSRRELQEKCSRYAESRVYVIFEAQGTNDDLLSMRTYIFWVLKVLGDTELGWLRLVWIWSKRA